LPFLPRGPAAARESPAVTGVKFFTCMSGGGGVDCSIADRTRPLQFDAGWKVDAVLYGNFAMSGEQEGSPICCLCGFIAEFDDWNSFDHQWRALLAGCNCDFDAVACLHGTGNFQSRHALLAGLSELLVNPALVPMGAFVIREHLSGLSSTARAVLAAEGIALPLDVILHDLTGRIVRLAHEESEKSVCLWPWSRRPRLNSTARFL
jgi:hypothetical protein